MKNTLILLSFLFLISPWLHAADRVALVIGNNAYGSESLKKARSDAESIGDVLHGMGYQVIRTYDASRIAMDNALSQFGQRASKADIAVVYYAGHAIQVNGKNYLIPSNTTVNRVGDLRKLINLDDLVLEAQQAKGLGLVLLDACRNNPFADGLSDNLGRSVSSRGLARVESTPTNVLISFATKENNIAPDDSHYARALRKYLPQSHLEVRLLMGAIRDDVLEASGNQQQPHVYGTLGRQAWYLPRQTLSLPIDETTQVNVDQSSSSSTKPPTSVTAAPKAYIQPDMLSIPKGCFQMGQTAAEKQWLIKQADQADYDNYFSDEKQHKVCVQAFDLARHEVTVAEFKRFVQATGHKTDAEKNKGQGCYSFKNNEWQWVSGRSWKNVGYQQTDQHPVACVSWQDATAYASWLSKQTGDSYRLPSEAEWEYAARAGSSSMRYWGNDDNNQAACQSANVSDQTAKEKYRFTPIFACRDGYAAAAPVGQFAANRWGLHDMLGNVWEWTCSPYAVGYDGSELKCANTNDSRSRVLRGGSWHNEPWNLRSAYRYWSTATSRYYTVGFRLARTR